jgi:NAD(P)-dependent dehydrogenase (short-subunit alcohol dehydrogenase family)
MGAGVADMEQRFAGRAALVTGGGRGIGRAIALRLAAEGAEVVVGYQSHAAAAEEVARQAGGRSCALPADTAEPAAAAGLVEEAVRRLGRLDIVVNNAGMLARRSLLDTDDATWDRILAVNLGGYFRVARAAAAVMTAGGCIVNVASVNAVRPSATAGAYAVSKAGVSMLTRQLALELAPRGIRVNEVCPGLVETDLNRHDLAQAEFRTARLARIPLGRIGAPPDVAGAVAFLCSDDAALITGASLLVDGGAAIA